MPVSVAIMASISVIDAGALPVGHRPALDAQPRLGGSSDDLRLPPALQLVILDQEEQQTHAGATQARQVAAQLAAIDAPGIARRSAVLAGKEGQPQPAGEPVSDVVGVEPVDPKRWVERLDHQFS